MYLAVRYARRKYKARQQKKTGATDQDRDTENAHPIDATAAVEGSPDGASNSAPPEAITPAPINNVTPATTDTGKKEKKEKKEEMPEEKVEKKRRRRYRTKIIFGLTFPFTLQALDTTIIASALPFIAADFNEISQLNWIITSFNLTGAAFLPFWAQIADIFGRHVALQASVITVAVGSALCTGAPTSTYGVLLLGRALQGVGAAGINICVRTILADRVDLAEYAKNWTFFALVSAIGFSVGPVAGGYLTQITWRWCFGINLPVAALAVVLVVLLLRSELLGPQPLPELEETEHGRKRMRDKSTKWGRFLLRLATIDYGGQLLFLWGIGLLVLALTWAGGAYAWSSAAVIAPLVIGAVLTCSWLLYEYSMAPGRVMARVFPLQRAMMPWTLLVNRDIGLLFLINFTVGMAMFAVMYFLDLYFALVRGNTASSAGLALLYFLPGLGVGVYSAMFFCNVWPRQTQPTLILATICSATGITALAWATDAENIPLVYGMMALTGYGVGLSFIPGALHALAYFPAMTAAIQCLVAFAPPFGGTVGLTLMATVFNNKSGPNHANAKAGIHWAFIAIMPIMWLSVLVSISLGNVWIRPAKEGGHDVVNGAWIWSLIAGKKLQRQKMIRGDPVKASSTQEKGVVVGDSPERAEAQGQEEARERDNGHEVM